MKTGAVFCGIGGFCRGFESEGFNTSWAVDDDKRVEETYRFNHPNTMFFRQDVRQIENCRVGSRALEPVDVLHAGFPCQSFSSAGARKGFDDERGKLFFDLMRLICDFKDRKPAVLVLENSPNLKIGRGGSWFARVKTEIQKAGYWFNEANALTLDPREVCGSPQTRPRLFMLAFNREVFRNGRTGPIERSTEAPSRLSSAISFEPIRDPNKRYYLDPRNKYFEMISKKRIPERETLYQLRKYVVRVKENICPTLTANMGTGGHNVPFLFDNKGLRKLTEYECLKLQGFENFDFPFGLPAGSRYEQIGNAVHVGVARRIALVIKAKIRASHPA